jgi:hypothetical protein
MNFGFSYEPEEDDLISYESIILHWLEQLMTMETLARRAGGGVAITALFQFLVRGQIRAGDDTDAREYLVDLLKDRAAGMLTPIEQYNVTTWELEEVAVTGQGGGEQ